MQARSATLHFPNVLARFAAPNLAPSASSKQIRAHPARRAFYFSYTVTLESTYIITPVTNNIQQKSNSLDISIYKVSEYALLFTDNIIY